MRKTLIAFATAATLIAAPAAAHESAEETITISVQTSDLDLSNTADQDRLNNRIDTAISRACRSGGRDLASRRAEAACRDSLSAEFAGPVALAIGEAGSETYAALEFSIKA
ncbi:UrcA family protein [Aurantiacibacter sp. D1-12]|uniref:UrcA family protein n=1 Tax=Aurantiacibacter sp. D1-12 TaxID=2993658 RepID=UPI00237D2C3F|nr:UrcA family protein [Aurantiacibacter sp. D1-12]MDE1466690.1 UrcA family protein [Aurantiacibacter sp. D1-12]